MERFRVHSVQETTVAVPAVMEDGTEVEGRLRVLVVELVQLESWGGTLTVKERVPTNEALAAALAKYARGAVIEATFKQVEAPAPASQAAA